MILTEEMKQTFLLITNYLNNFILYNLKVQASKRDEEPRTRDDEIEEAEYFLSRIKNNTKLFDLTNYLRLKFQRKGWFISISTLMDKPIEVEEIQKLLEETLKKISYDLVLK